MKVRSGRMTSPGYKSYSFKKKDPLIGILATVLKDSGIEWEDLPEFSGVTGQTYWSWFEGPTRTIRVETLMATLRVLPTESQKDFWRRVAHEQIVEGIGKGHWVRHLRVIAGGRSAG